MEPKIKNKNKNKKWFVITLFFALLQISHANIALSASITAEEMVSLTNKSRAEAGLPSLLVNEKLTNAAREKADDMFEFQYFDHNSPSGLTPWDFIKSAGYDYRYAGENLAIDFVTANGAHKALMESSSHRENILNSNYTEIGIVAVEGMFDGNKSIIIVEEFGTPLKKEIAMDYSLNENIELILEEKLNEVNNLKSDSEEEEKLEELSQTGLPAEQAGSTQACLPDKQEYRANGLEEESVTEQDDDLLLSDLSTDFGIWNPAFKLFENGQDKKEKESEELSQTGLPAGQAGSTQEYGANEGEEYGVNGLEEKSSSAIIEYNPILLAGNLDSERVMGLVNKAHAKDEYIRKYNYQQNSAGPAVNRCFQNEFIGRVLSLYAILSVALISNFMITIHFYRKRKEYNC